MHDISSEVYITSFFFYPEGHHKGKSVLIEEGALYWMITNSSTYSASTRRHIELALCHLAQNGTFAMN